ncbi:unnamed protein product [Amaranthus hypochondriacus]
MRGILAVIIVLIGMVECKKEAKVPCYYIFGDSLSDAGNNNQLNTLAKANYPPYGLDFPGGIPTGRFSNGLTFVDRITELLGFKDYIPPYSTAKGKQILKGVNYASGAAGIRSETGQHLGERISMDEQLKNHAVTIAKLPWYAPLTGLLNLKKCLYTVNMGSNDYINNYFNPDHYSSSSLYTPQQYAELLTTQYAAQLKKLYFLGARKVAVFGLGLVGCSLGEIYSFGTNGSLCVDKINYAVQLFNDKLIGVVDDLNSNLSGAQFTFIGSGGSSDTGTAVVNAPCCKVREDFQCVESNTVCEDRNNYIFFDGYHTTELVNILAAETAYSAPNSNAVHPVDIKTLISTDNNKHFIVNPSSTSVSAE